MTASPAKTQRGIQSVEVAGRLLQALAQARQPLPLVELAAAAELSSAQAHTYLVSLLRLGLIKRTPGDGRYEAGPLALRLGMARLAQEPAYRLALPQVQQLSQETGLSVALTLPTPEGPTIVHYAHAGKPLHVNLHVGTVMALSETATGRTYCAYTDPAAWQGLWEAQHPGQSRARLKAFHEELETIRKRGMERAVDLPSPGVTSLCMPLLEETQQLLLLVTVIGSSGVIDPAWRGSLARQLRECIEAIATTLATKREECRT
ncbi:IclR family transcriptional regulator [Herbaspirillum rubrisubalbicans]|uniref:IclR family transcriptional regulator n=1 Tax=Herbaspirillum rubrisubalbicans TaxID=80842 RepID=A0AAD0XEU8_9BURK|nr:helix-turn-helix domain-containing protein [Herbaspirillum rubrisubalbicans]ALU87754.1 IclR family transcription regulator protein [Herbaspirillum rubrisubalbicans M1]AYR22807.1 IclR family transcriptional regulator [Herbaspirillum rubrisubalbicans]